MFYKCISVFALCCSLFLGLHAADPTTTIPAAEETGRIEAVAGKFGVTWPTLIAQMVNFIFGNGILLAQCLQ